MGPGPAWWLLSGGCRGAGCVCERAGPAWAPAWEGARQLSRDTPVPSHVWGRASRSGEGSGGVGPLVAGGDGNRPPSTVKLSCSGCPWSACWRLPWALPPWAPAHARIHAPARGCPRAGESTWGGPPRRDAEAHGAGGSRRADPTVQGNPRRNGESSRRATENRELTSLSLKQEMSSCPPPERASAPTQGDSSTTDASLLAPCTSHWAWGPWGQRGCFLSPPAPLQPRLLQTQDQTGGGRKALRGHPRAGTCPGAHCSHDKPPLPEAPTVRRPHSAGYMRKPEAGEADRGRHL